MLAVGVGAIVCAWGTNLLEQIYKIILHPVYIVNPDGSNVLIQKKNRTTSHGRQSKYWVPASWFSTCGRGKVTAGILND